MGMDVNWDNANGAWSVPRGINSDKGTKAYQEAPGKSLGSGNDPNVEYGYQKDSDTKGRGYASLYGMGAYKLNNWLFGKQNPVTIEEVDPSKIQEENKERAPVPTRFAIVPDPTIKELL